VKKGAVLTLIAKNPKAKADAPNIMNDVGNNGFFFAN